jgi:hypothetical protein
MSMHRSSSTTATSFASLQRQTWGRLFGSLIQEGRQATGRTVEEAAKLAGMESSEWAAIEAGYVPTDLSCLRPMAAALEIRYDQMAMTVHLCQGAWKE